MSTGAELHPRGIRDPYRSLLIFSGGVLLALALLIGQAGYRDDVPSSSGKVGQRSSAVAGIETSR